VLSRNQSFHVVSTLNIGLVFVSVLFGRSSRRAVPGQDVTIVLPSIS